jgi:PIN domain nuclease of toxin-antitoxin system
VRVLLDTHLLLWSLSAPHKLSAATAARIDASEVYASAASIWEISIKSALGKLSADPRDVLAGIVPAGFSLLAITGEHAAKVMELPPLHKDPFDRLLLAQSLVEPMLLLTNDEALRDYGPFVIFESP